MQDFRDRASAAEAVRNRAVPYLGYFYTEGGLYQRAHMGSALDDLCEPGEGSLCVRAVGEATFDQFGDDDDTRGDRAIAAFNAGEVTNLYGSGNTYRRTRPLPPITASDGMIDGRHSRINLSGADARFFQALGDFTQTDPADQRQRRLTVRDFTLAVMTPAQASGAALTAANVTDVEFLNLDPVNVPAYFHLDGAAQSNRVRVQGATGSWRAERDQPILHLEAGAVIDIRDNDIKGASSTDIASSVLIRPRQIIDTVRMYDNAMFAGHGMLHGVHCLMEDFPVTNFWAGGNVFDRAKGSAYFVRASGTADKYMKHWSIEDKWLRSLGGHTIDVVNEGTRHDVEKFKILKATISTGGLGAIRFRGTGGPGATLRGLLVDGCDIQDDGFYIEGIEAGPDPWVTLSQSHLLVPGSAVMVDGINGTYAALNGERFIVGAVERDRFRLVGADTSGFGTFGWGGMVSRVRTAMIDTNAPGGRIVNNDFSRRVAMAPAATSAAIRAEGAASDLFHAGNVLHSVEKLFAGA